MTISPDAINVLVIDDEKDIRDGVERILTRMNCSVIKAPRGEEGLKILEKEKVSIVLLDMKMPGMDGMEVLGLIRKLDESILVIVITGFATVETAIEAMKRGAYDFIPKPFEPDQLRIVINRAVERIRLTKEAELLERERQQTLFDLDTEKSRIRTIIESLPNGVVVTNSQGQVVLMNPSFRKLLDLKSDLGPGEHINDYVSEKGLCDLIMEISQGKHVDFDDIPTYEFAVSGNKYLLARGQPVLGERRECMGAVVNVVDITTMKALDQLKSEFVAKVSHELRSPLSTIHEQLAVVLQDMVEDDLQADQEILSRAKEKTMGLISLIGDLLDLSRIEAGITSQEPKSVSIEDVLKNITDFLNTKAKSKEQTLTLELPKKRLPSITTDPVSLESLFGNLITNAIHYTQNGGKIKVKVDLTGINLRIAVIDNGFGIQEKYLDKIFDRFYRVKDDKTRFITGTGLGLPIVKGIVDSLGGMIDVESTSGEGTTFTVILPLQNQMPVS
ncbi:MAG: response regulator [Deltaproteobacteria bacterium]|nr:response regulator [Deltaproteobacteria bacterium]